MAWLTRIFELQAASMPRNLLILLTFILLIWGLFGAMETVELRAEEPRRAIVAMEMVLSDNYTAPTIHGEPYYNKPPLFNWVMAAGFNLFDSFSEWVVRLPALLSLLLMAGLHFFVTRKYLGQTIATWSSLLLLVCGDLLFYGTINAGEIDIFYALLVYCQAIALFHFSQTKQWWWFFIVSYLFAGLGVLTKGMPSLAFQALSLLVVLISQREWKRLFYPHHFAGIAVLAAVVGGYFYAYAQQQDVSLYLANLVEEATHKTTGDTAWGKVFTHIGAFPLTFLQLMVPGALLVIFLFQKGKIKQARQEPMIWFSILFILANIWLYWVSTGTKNRYLYPFFPFFLTIVVWAWQTGKEQWPRLVKWSTLVLGGILTLLVPIAIGLLFWEFPIELFSGWWLTFLLPALAILLVVVFWVNPKTRVTALFAGLLLVRVLFNETVLPITQATQENLDYREKIEELLTYTGTEPVYYTGPLYAKPFSASLGPVELGDYIRKTPPLIAYQVPYYLTAGNGHIMQHHLEPKPGLWYIADEQFAAASGAFPVFTFRDRWMSRNLVLFKLDENSGFALGETPRS